MRCVVFMTIKLLEQACFFSVCVMPDAFKDKLSLA